ncbi:MAG TPA: T9SS type A sorting domain-containing protein [Ignavibacteria bacterium]|nr:T9SS type A sorting domain-containing protein [Ignavibacteria bacterium]HMR41107.1 T9SS type A sorting domain-containing protein [Ignavibacteria bacterium]
MKFYFCIIIFFISANLFAHSNINSSGNNPVTEILFIKEDGTSGESLFYNDILKLGYSADITGPENITIEKIELYGLVVLSTGNYPFACQNSGLRLALQTYITENIGKVLIEGGNNGYIAAIFPGYLGFMTKVIKIDNWIADDGGALDLSETHTFSPLATEPNVLPATININYTGIYNQDVCTKNDFSELFYGSSLYPGKVGILVAPNVNNPQVINYFVTYSSFADNSAALKLLENSLYNLIGKPVSVYNISSAVPDKYYLYQNYPNPFNPDTKIKFDVMASGRSGSANLKLSVFNSSGKLVSEILNGKFSSGTYEADFDATDIAAGIYFYKLYSEDAGGNFSQTRKMIILK